MPKEATGKLAAFPLMVAALAMRRGKRTSSMSEVRPD